VPSMSSAAEQLSRLERVRRATESARFQIRNILIKEKPAS
jgi:hypothetical protein